MLATVSLFVSGATLGCGSGASMSLQGALKISPGSLNFGDVSVGQIVDSSIALVNSGAAPIAISQVSIAGQMFALANADQLPISIAPGATHSVKVGFAPATENDFSGELTVADSSAKPIAVLAMYGHGGQRGQLVASPTALSFGSIATGSSSSATVSLSWTGSYPVTLNSITTNGSGFSTAGVSLPLTLNPGQTVALKVQFAPISNGASAGQIAIGWGSHGGSTVIGLSGTGQAAAGEAELTLSTAKLNFGTMAVNSAISQAVTLTSTGTSPVTVNSATIGGSGFSLGSTGLPVTLAPNQSMTLKVKFNPTTAGTVSGQLVVNSNSVLGGTSVVALAGVGAEAPTTAQLAVSATKLSFGSVTVNSATTQAVTLTSTGTGPVTVNSATVSGSGFLLSGGSLPITLNPMQSTTLQVKFEATTTGTLDGQLTIQSDSTTDGTAVVALEGVGAAAPNPQLTVSAAALSFGSVTVDSSTTQALTLSSTGTSAVTVSAATLTGAGFAIVGGSIPATLNPGQTMTLQVQFAPTTAGTVNGQLVLSSDSSSGNRTTISLSGTSTAAPNPQLSLSAAKLSFGSVTVNSATTQALTLTSTGTSPVTVSTATATGPGFTISGGTLPITLNPMESTTLQVEFDPTTTGTLDGQLTIKSDSTGGSTAVVSLEGTGSAAPIPQLTVSAGTLSFGSVTVNSSTTQALTLTSTGTAPVTVSAAKVSGAGFSIAKGGFPVMLAPGQSITVEIGFAPTTTGSLTGQLKLSSDSSSGATTLVSLSGTSTAAATPQLTLSAMTLTFASEPVGTATSQALTLTSTGTAAVTIHAATTTGAGFSITSGSFPATLNPGQSMTVQVQFDPTALGSSTGQITITSDSTSGATTAVALKGTGTALSIPQLTVSTTALSFGNETVNAAATKAITLTSTGTLAVTVNSVAITGAGFSVTGGSFPVTLAPGQSVAVTVQYKPTAAGSDTGQVTISSNSTTGSSAVVSLSGTGVALAHEIDLSWDAPASSPDPVAGYNVYRALGSGTLTLLNSSPLKSPAYIDTAIASASTYNYVVKSVDASSVESAASNEFTVTIP